VRALPNALLVPSADDGCAFRLMRATLRGLLPCLGLLRVETLFSSWASDSSALNVVPPLEASFLEISLGLRLQAFGFDEASTFVLLPLATW
jgi:hypothetical protein